jgi:hypothetical protein
MCFIIFLKKKSYYEKLGFRVFEGDLNDLASTKPRDPADEIKPDSTVDYKIEMKKKSKIYVK